MRRKLLVSALCLTLVTTSSSVVFASDAIDGQQIIAEHQAGVKAKNIINERQNSTFSKFVNVMTFLTGIMPGVNLVVGYSASAFGGVQSGISSDLEYQEDLYEKIYEVFTSTTSKYKKATRARIVYPLKGVWKGNSRGYVYTLQREYVVFYSATGAKLDI